MREPLPTLASLQPSASGVSHAATKRPHNWKIIPKTDTPTTPPPLPPSPAPYLPQAPSSGSSGTAAKAPRLSPSITPQIRKSSLRPPPAASTASKSKVTAKALASEVPAKKEQVAENEFGHSALKRDLLSTQPAGEAQRQPWAPWHTFSLLAALPPGLASIPGMGASQSPATDKKILKAVTKFDTSTLCTWVPALQVRAVCLKLTELCCVSQGHRSAWLLSVQCFMRKSHYHWLLLLHWLQALLHHSTRGAPHLLLVDTETTGSCSEDLPVRHLLCLFASRVAVRMASCVFFMISNVNRPNFRPLSTFPSPTAFIATASQSAQCSAAVSTQDA